jgi:hypothetical protein
LPQNLHRCLAAAVLALLSAAALVLVARRLAGALTNPLEPVTLLVIGALVAAAAAAIRLGWFLPPAAGRPMRLDRAMMLLTSLAVAALAAGACLPGTSAIGTCLLCTLLGAEESWAWAVHLRRHRESPPARRAVRLDAAHAPLARGNRGVTSFRPAIDASEAALSEDITQQLTRSQAADGVDELSGWLRIAFPAGGRTGSIHVAFCPPFAATPELALEQLDGPEARIKTAQLMPYGARLDLKLAAAADGPTRVLLQFSARTTRKKE